MSTPKRKTRETVVARSEQLMSLGGRDFKRQLRLLIPTTCNRLRLGGTVSGSTISGGTSIQNDRLFTISPRRTVGASRPARWKPQPSLSSTDSSGGQANDRCPRQITLSVEVMDRDANGLIPTTRGAQWEANMDLLLELVDGNGESVILERDMADGSTRFLECEAITPWAFSDGLRTVPTFPISGRSRWNATIPTGSPKLSTRRRSPRRSPHRGTPPCSTRPSRLPRRGILSIPTRGIR